MKQLTWKVITNELCTQNGIRRIVLDEPLRAKVGEGLSFSIPSGAIGPNDQLKLFVGFEHTCPKDLNVNVNGEDCTYLDFGNESYIYLHDPSLKPHVIGAYRFSPAVAAPADQTLTITGSPDGYINYLELKVTPV